MLHQICKSKAIAALKKHQNHKINVVLIISWKLVKTFQIYQESAMSIDKGIKAGTYLAQCPMSHQMMGRHILLLDFAYHHVVSCLGCLLPLPRLR